MSLENDIDSGNDNETLFAMFKATNYYEFDSSPFHNPVYAEIDSNFATQISAAALNYAIYAPATENLQWNPSHVGVESSVHATDRTTAAGPDFCGPSILEGPGFQVADGNANSTAPMDTFQGSSKMGTENKIHKISRLPQEAVLLLQNWMIQHREDPYPTLSEKDRLAVATGLTVKQVNDWISHARTRRLGRKANSGNGSSTSCMESLSCEPDASGKREILALCPERSPIERYLVSPPRDEPAALDAIRNAAESAPAEQTQSCFSQTTTEVHAPEKTLSDSGYYSRTMSGLSSGSIGSHSSLGSHTSLVCRKGRKNHRGSQNYRRQQLQIQKYQCTWCLSSFSRPSDWQRHEESLHAPQVQWICLLDVNLEDETCAFCEQSGPSVEHYETQHNARQCFSRPDDERAFDRKDHLQQHIKQVHHQSVMSSRIENWVRPVINSVPGGGWRCGFCHSTFTDWKERVKHVRAHFDSGLDMQWWDLSPASTLLSRISRCALQHPTVYCCSRCCRGFKTEIELREHRQIPHLARREWTCSDAYSALLSSIPNLPQLSEGTLSHTLPSQPPTECFHCRWTNTPSPNFADWKELIRWHFLVYHKFSGCRESFLDVDVFQSHLYQNHGIYPHAPISASVFGYMPLTIATCSSE